MLLHRFARFSVLIISNSTVLQLRGSTGDECQAATFSFYQPIISQIWENKNSLFVLMKDSVSGSGSLSHALCDTSNDGRKEVVFAGASWDIPGPILQIAGHVCSWKCAAWWEDCICLPTKPPLSWAHQANWSVMWGSRITARRAPLYGSRSFYTFCCITVKDNQHAACPITECPNNKLFTAGTLTMPQFKLVNLHFSGLFKVHTKCPYMDWNCKLFKTTWHFKWYTSFWRYI